MKKLFGSGTVAIVLLSIVFSAMPAHGQRVEFNYNGRIKSQGQPFDGQGLFKFALTSEDGTVAYWANDGVTLDGSEPTTSVMTTVTHGSFSVNIGDTAMAGMGALDASLFNDKDRVLLRVWFSDGTHGFQHILPDAAVTNPALLGGQSLKTLDLYVNPVTGNDQYPGNRPTRPKKTIQSAWNVLPPLIRRDATIHLADGIYREEVNMKGKQLGGEAMIAIVGNMANPAAVRVTGANAGAETVAVRKRGFYLENQKGVVVRGILFDYTASAPAAPFGGGIMLEKGADATVENCKFLMNAAGITCMGSRISVSTSEFGGSSKNSNDYGIQIHTESRGDLTSCSLHDLAVGISVNRLAAGNIISTTISSCFIGGAFGNLADVEISTTAISGCDYGISCSYNAITKGSASIANSGNIVNRQASNGGLFYL